MLPPALIDAMSQVLDSCDDTTARLHKAFIRLTCCDSPKNDWETLKNESLVNIRHDLGGCKIVLDLVLDYVALYVFQRYTTLWLTQNADYLGSTNMTLLIHFWDATSPNSSQPVTSC